MPVIKRYPNRKMYNTETKQYITLDELADLIRRGEDIHVFDNATGNDLTALTMTQILFEQVKKQAGFLPRTVLTGLIQAGGSRVSALQRVLAASLGLGHQADEEIRRRITSLIEQGELTREQGLSLMEKLMSQRGDTDEVVTEQEIVEKVLSEREVASGTELQRLLEEIEAVAEKLDDLTRQETSQLDDDQSETIN